MFNFYFTETMKSFLTDSLNRLYVSVSSICNDPFDPLYVLLEKRETPEMGRHFLEE